jgi:hypothetical protein
MPPGVARLTSAQVGSRADLAQWVEYREANVVLTSDELDGEEAVLLFRQWADDLGYTIEISGNHKQELADGFTRGVEVIVTWLARDGLR